MRIAILGAGRMGRVAALDLAQQDDVEFVCAYDSSQQNLDALSDMIAMKTKCPYMLKQLDFNCDPHEISNHLKHNQIDVAIVCTGYQLNFGLTVACIHAGVHMVDLGGNVDVVERQKTYDSQAKRKDITIIPDCGLAPGLASILGMMVYKQLHRPYSIKMRVGGLPLDRNKPIGYDTTWSVEGLINEYVEDCTVIKHGEICHVPALDDLETMVMNGNQLEAFNTSGGASNLPKLLQGKVEMLDYKTLRYPGHYHAMRGLRDLGMFQNRPGFGFINTREFSKALFERVWKGTDEDVVFLRVDGISKDNDCISYEMVEYARDGITAMARTTATSAATIAHMIGDGSIDKRGVVCAEDSIPHEDFVTRLQQRGLEIWEVKDG